MHFAEMSSGSTNPTELVALLIIQGKNFREGIENVFHHIKGSCTMMILTEDGIICARDSWGRTPLIIGKKEGAYAASSETTSFPNLDFETAHEVGPGEIVRSLLRVWSRSSCQQEDAGLFFPLGTLWIPNFYLRGQERRGKPVLPMVSILPRQMMQR